jgi:hypothetical protein
MRLPRAVTATAALAVALTAGGCADQPSQAEFDRGIAAFDALPDEAKAYACADDWYAVQLEVEGFVIIERCGDGPDVPVTSSQPLSESFERAEQAYAVRYYAENPPDSGRLTEQETDAACDQDEADIGAAIRQWREQSQFPSWDGVEYVPSVEHETAKLKIWQDVACQPTPE